MPAGKTDKWCEGGTPPRDYVESDKRRIVRCPVCNRRLMLQQIFCVGGEFVGFKIPPHKAKK